MSLTIIAMTGILLGFLCLIVGFFMEGLDGRGILATPKVKRVRSAKKRTVGSRKAA